MDNFLRIKEISARIASYLKDPDAEGDAIGVLTEELLTNPHFDLDKNTTKTLAALVSRKMGFSTNFSTIRESDKTDPDDDRSVLDLLPDLATPEAILLQLESVEEEEDKPGYPLKTWDLRTMEQDLLLEDFESNKGFRYRLYTLTHGVNPDTYHQRLKRARDKTYLEMSDEEMVIETGVVVL